MARRSNSGIDATTFKDLINYVKADLGIAHLDIVFRFRPAKTFGGMAKWRKYSGGKVRDAEIVINANEPFLSVEWIIAHELRHVWQRANGKLTSRYNTNLRSWCLVWTEHNYEITRHEVEKLFSRNQTAYQTLPWEYDANEYATNVIKAWRNS